LENERVRVGETLANVLAFTIGIVGYSFTMLSAI
jgi:hypothetical protein